MAHLHYRLAQRGREWVLSDEDVAINAFEFRRDGLLAAEAAMAAARERGDKVSLSIQKRRVRGRQTKD
jgi:hypothetical protein